MATDNNYEFILSDPWGIEFSLNEDQVSYDLMNDVTAQAAQLALNEQKVPGQPKSSVSWSDHEKLTGEILNEAAQRVAAETFKNICVYHPTQNHKPSQNTPGDGIRPDYIIAWSCNGVRRNTAVVDAKDYHGQVPREEYKKIRRDMRETKATRGILVLSPDASISDKLRTDIENDNKVDIVQVKNNKVDAVREVTQHIGKIIQNDFVPDDKRYETYREFVTSTNKSQERKPNRYGENDQYTCNSTYHRFEHPRNQDGTIDERYAANRDRNQDGSPDMRKVHNKTKEAQEQHLNEDGSNDMRSKEHREQLVDATGHRLNADGSPDKRCEENKTEVPANTSPSSNNGQTTENMDMRLKENREDMVDNEGHHLNVDGSPDKRCEENKAEVPANTSSDSNDNQATDNADMRLKENREDMVDNEGHHLNVDGSPDKRCIENQEDNEAQPSVTQPIQEEADTTIPTKSDGTADMRCTASKEAVAEGIIEPNEQLTEVEDTIATGNNEAFSEGSSSTDIPTKSDGTADMRFNASQEAVASGEISRDEVLNGNSEDLTGGTLESSLETIDGGESDGGPLKADGTPDMRFSANQE